MVNSLEWADRTMYESIRAVLITDGRLPDKRTLTSEQYTAAKIALKASGSLIVLHGVGMWDGKGARPENAIAILRKTDREGGVGGGVPQTQSNGNGTYKQVMLPGKTSNLVYEINFVCNNVDTERYIITMLDTLFERPGTWIKSISENGQTMTGDPVYVQFSYDFDQGSEYGLGHKYHYIMKDVWVADAKVLVPVLPEADKITASPVVNNNTASDIEVQFP